MTNKQKAALGLCAAAAIMLLFSAVTKTWFHNKLGYAGEFNMGLLSVESCFQKECETQSLNTAASKKEYGTFVLAGQATFGLGLVSVAMLLATAFLGFRRHDRVSQIGKITLLVLILTIAGALIVMIKRPPLANASLGVFLFMIGGMAGVLGAQMLSSPATYEEVERDPSIPRL